MNYRKTISVLLIITWLAAGSFMTQIASAETLIMVTTITDSVTDDGQCSLREAVIAANTDITTGGCSAGSGADTIAFDSSLPSPAVFTLTLSGANEDNAATGDLDLSGIITIQGTNAGQIIIDGNKTDRVFEIRPGATVTISDVTIQNGNPGSGANGGGIIVSGGTPRAKLTLMNSIISNNTAANGGGIQNLGNGAAATIENTHISSNAASVSGGGISNTGVLAILNSTLDRNQARTGGGIDHSGFTLNLTNVTISDNNASDDGGGIYNRADALIQNATLTGNSANGSGTGGNIFNDTASLSIRNSIVANSIVDGNCFNSEGFINSQGHNLDDGNTCGFTKAGDLINVDPLLADLQDNGGDTGTHALLPGSPAIDAGDSAGCPKTDQRGYARPVDGDGNGSAVCDIGAFEFDGIPPIATSSPQPVETLTPTLTPAPIFTDTPTPIVTTNPATPVPTPIPQVPPCCSSAALILAAFFLKTRLRLG